MNRLEKRHNKKKGKLKKISFTILIFLLVFVGYVIFQYNQGLNLAGSSNVTKEDTSDFQGVEERPLGKVNILLLGVDSRDEEEQARTDTIMIAQYDPKNHKAKVVSVMRDIYAEIPGYRNYKINTAYFLGGAELLRQTIKANFDIDLHYYALVDFKGFEKMVDALAPNGIEVDVEKRMSEKISVVLEPGLQKLNGKELLGYARFRQDAEGDFGRVQRQQKVLNVLKDELISINGVTKAPKLLGTIQPYMETNMDSLDQLSFLKDFILNPPKDIETLRIPIENSYTDGYYEHAGSVLEIDKEQNKQALHQFLSGEVEYAQENRNMEALGE